MCVIPPRVVPAAPKRSRSMSIRRTDICLAHNGNLTNAEELKRELFMDDQRAHQYRF